MRDVTGRIRRKTSAVGMICVAAPIAALCLPMTVAGASSSHAHKGHVSTKAGVAHARKALAQFSKPYRKLPTAGRPIPGVSAFKGKSVWYVPIISTSPFFTEVGVGQQQALSQLGMTYHLCAGSGTPTSVASCVNQAVSSGAVGIFTTSLPYGFAASAFRNAESHGVPVIFGNDGHHKSTDHFAYVTPSVQTAEALGADWMIAKSNGKAHVLYTQVTTSNAAASDVSKGGVPEFHKYCPKCSVTLEKFLVVDLSALSSEVSTALTSHPTAKYIFSEYDTFVTTVITGLVSSGATSKEKIVGVEADVASMQRVKDGHQAADIAIGAYEFGWAKVDELLRMLKGMPTISTYHIGMRIFTSANIHAVPLNVTAQNDGAWVGPTAHFKKYFKSLWK